CARDRGGREQAGQAGDGEDGESAENQLHGDRGDARSGASTRPRVAWDFRKSESCRSAEGIQTRSDPARAVRRVRTRSTDGSAEQVRDDRLLLLELGHAGGELRLQERVELEPL